MPADDKSREDFERWFGDDGQYAVPRICDPGCPCAGEYDDKDWQDAWNAWTAATRIAAERAAKLCDHLGRPKGPFVETPPEDEACRDCARAIRREFGVAGEVRNG